MQRFIISSIFARRESGTTLLETVVALALLGIIVVTFLNGLTTTSKAAFISDEQATAESLAQSQMEWVKKAEYEATGYSPATIPSGKDYLNYSVIIAADTVPDRDGDIQKITVTVTRSDEVVTTLEGYKRR